MKRLGRFFFILLEKASIRMTSRFPATPTAPTVALMKSKMSGRFMVTMCSGVSVPESRTNSEVDISIEVLRCMPVTEGVCLSILVSWDFCNFVSNEILLWHQLVNTIFLLQCNLGKVIYLVFRV